MVIMPDPGVRFDRGYLSVGVIAKAGSKGRDDFMLSTVGCSSVVNKIAVIRPDADGCAEGFVRVRGTVVAWAFTPIGE